MSLSPTKEQIYLLLSLCRAKIVSSTNRSEILPIGKRGELVVSGYLLQKGYWNDPVKTDEVMVTDEEGKRWMHVRFTHRSYSCELTWNEQTGDEAEMDAEGYIKVVSLLKT